MSWNVFKRINWKSRPVRVTIVVLALFFVGAVHYWLAHFPSPIEIRLQDPINPLKATLGNEKLVIVGPELDWSEGAFLSYTGHEDEVVEVYAGRAELAEETVNRFRQIGMVVPAIVGPIDYLLTDEEEHRSRDHRCKTTIEIKLRSAAKQTSEIRLFQLGDPGMDQFRQLEVESHGVDLTVRMNTFAAETDAPSNGCKRLLRVGNWNQQLPSSFSGINLVIPADSDLRMYFKRAGPDRPNLRKSDELFDRLMIGTGRLNSGDPPPLQARSVEVRGIGEGQKSGKAEPLLRAQSPNEKPTLRLLGLKIGSDQLLLSVLGKARVQNKGEDTTIDLLVKYPAADMIVKGVEGALVLMLGGLLYADRIKQFLLGQAQPPTTGPQNPSGSQQKRRKGKPR